MENAPKIEKNGLVEKINRNIKKITFLLSLFMLANCASVVEREQNEFDKLKEKLDKTEKELDKAQEMELSLDHLEEQLIFKVDSIQNVRDSLLKELDKVKEELKAK
jgi:hypothetical protein